MFDPVTYVCFQSEPFEQLWQGTTKGSFLLSLVKYLDPVHKLDILTIPGIGVYSFLIVDFVRGHVDVEYSE